MGNAAVTSIKSALENPSIKAEVEASFDATFVGSGGDLEDFFHDLSKDDFRKFADLALQDVKGEAAADMIALCGGADEKQKQMFHDGIFALFGRRKIQLSDFIDLVKKHHQRWSGTRGFEHLVLLKNKAMLGYLQHGRSFLPDEAKLLLAGFAKEDKSCLNSTEVDEMCAAFAAINPSYPVNWLQNGAFMSFFDSNLDGKITLEEFAQDEETSLAIASEALLEKSKTMSASELAAVVAANQLIPTMSLRQALLTEDRAAVRRLLEAKACPRRLFETTVKDNLLGHPDAVRVLLSEGVDPVPHFLAAVRGLNPATIRVFLEAKADPNFVGTSGNAKGYSVLHHMLSNSPINESLNENQLECARMLLEAKADPDAQDPYRMSVLRRYLGPAYVPFDKLLLEHKATVSEDVMERAQQLLGFFPNDEPFKELIRVMGDTVPDHSEAKS